jgi:hypothetical protein
MSSVQLAGCEMGHRVIRLIPLTACLLVCICAAAGASGLSGEQLEALATVLQGVQECGELMCHAEVPQVRLL